MFGMHALSSYGVFGVGLMALALLHYVRKQPEFYWLWIIIGLGPLGALIYLATQAAPELGDPGAFKFLDRRKRINYLTMMIRDNPSAGNYEELGQLYIDGKRWPEARECFNRALSQRADSPDPFYRRGIVEVQLGDFAAAKDDLEKVYARDRQYDYQRAAGLLAYAYARCNELVKAEALFNDVLRTSTLTETQLHYAELMAQLGRKDEARQVVEHILSKRTTMPGFLKRRERPLFRQAKTLLRTL
jgi:hypothetical protein